MKYKHFLTWWLFVSLLSLGGYYLWEIEYLQSLFNEDTTNISIVIAVTLLFISVLCGMSTFRLDYHGHNSSTEKDVDRMMELNQFAAGVFPALGLLGTIIGFKMILPLLSSIDPSNPAAIKETLGDLVIGVSIALSTTLVGIAASIILRTQNFNLTQALNKHSDDAETLS